MAKRTLRGGRGRAEGGPGAQRALLFAQDHPDFVDGLPTPIFQRLAVCMCKNARTTLSLVASLPPLRRLEESSNVLGNDVVLVLLVISGFWSKTMGCEPATSLLFKLHPCPRRADRTEIHPSSRSRFPCSPFQPLLPLPGRTHRDSKTSTAPPPFPIPIPALIIVSIRAQTRRDGCRRRGFHSPRLLPLHSPPVVIWHATTLDVRRAVGVGSASLRVPGVVAARHMSCLSHLPPTVAVSAVIPWLQRLRGARGY
ncbi:hypothetical protein B0H13DRAFT_2347264 [Mycena leptocephala]|nr:hypothetical protein B0H13DRAFT_2347264 [Mycena leptocephala]